MVEKETTNSGELNIKPLTREVLTEFPERSEKDFGFSESLSPEEIYETIVSKAQEEAELIKQKAYEEGYQQGKQNAEEYFVQEYQQLLNTLTEILSSVESERRKFLEEITPQIVELALQVAEKVVSYQVEVNSDIVFKIVQETLGEIVQTQQIIIRLNPDDLELVSQCKEIIEKLDHVNFVGDISVERGGCIVETQSHYIDNRISARLNRIREAFRELLRE